MPQAHDFRGNPQRTPPRGPHADRLEAGSRTAASQSGLHTGTFTIAYSPMDAPVMLSWAMILSSEL
jgi:hypothetical protein